MTTRKEVLESPTLLNLYAMLDKPLPPDREALEKAREALLEVQRELRAMRASARPQAGRLDDQGVMQFRRCPII
jgi:hypothetical protein